MKKSSLLICLIFMILIFGGCSKERNALDNIQTTYSNENTNADRCLNPTSKGRIIGFNPWQSFLNFDTSRFINYNSSLGLGPGYLIELDNGITKDTCITYRMTYKDFTISPTKDNIDFLYLFKRDFQDSLKIKFNYHTVSDNTQLVKFAATGNTQVLFVIWDNFIKNKKEVILSCVSFR
jgi:hypothetical protein